MIDALRRIFRRDLEALKREIGLYPDDAAVWKKVPGIANSGGTLVLHLAGNLQHFIGAQLGATGYVRNRDAEFAIRDLPRTRLSEEVAAAGSAVDVTLSTLDPGRLAYTFPIPVMGHTLETGTFLIHLTVHLGYHLGQIDYHRRVVTGQEVSAGALPIAGLVAPLPD